MLLDDKIKKPVEATKFELMNLIGELENLPPEDFKYFISALVNYTPKTADLLQASIRVEFQDKNI